jgi:hypothetical protein
VICGADRGREDQITLPALRFFGRPHRRGLLPVHLQVHAGGVGHVDEAGVDGQPRAVDGARVGRRGGALADGDDQPVAEDDRAALDGLAGAGDDARARDRVGVRAGAALRRGRGRGRPRADDGHDRRRDEGGAESVHTFSHGRWSS